MKPAGPRSATGPARLRSVTRLRSATPHRSAMGLARLRSAARLRSTWSARLRSATWSALLRSATRLRSATCSARLRPATLLRVRSARWPALCATLFTALLATTPVSGQTHVEGVAAIVGANAPRPDATVLLHSDVDLRARMRLARELGGRVPPGPLPEALMRATLDELIGEVLIAREARRVQLPAPTPNDLREERRRIELLAGGGETLEALLDTMGAPESELDEMAERRAMVRLFLEANLQGGTTVDDDEVRAFYESGEHPFIGQELDEVREPLRLVLQRRRIDAAVTRWVEALRARATIRVLAPYAG